MTDILYCPYLNKSKTPVGALHVYEETTLRLRITKSYNIYDLKIIVENDTKEVLRKPLYLIPEYDNFYNVYEVKLSFDSPYLYWYYFSFSDCYGTHYIGRDESLNAKLCDYNVKKFQLNVGYETTNDLSWFQGKVMYQIFPDRFNRSGKINKKETGYNHENWNEDVMYEPYNGLHCNDFYGGNFQGIIDKLPYLKELNVGIIYLNPICLSASSHRYNTSDYMKIDDLLGTEEDFINLVNKAKEYDISIILDGVYNHTGDDSIYFNKYHHFKGIGAFESKDSIYYSWFRFIDYPNKYYSWWGIDSLPSVNQKSGFVDYITGPNGVISKYMRLGVKGIRLDVVDELNSEFVEKINKRIKEEDNNAITIGEVWEDATNKVAYDERKTYFNGKELDSVMNYPVKNAIIDYLNNHHLEHLVYRLRDQINNYPNKVLNSLMNILSTHDTERIISILSQVNFNSMSKKEVAKFRLSSSEYYNARSKVKLAYTMLYTLPGIPSLYYGDEIGMEGGKDPFCRAPMNWDNGDSELLDYFIKLGRIRKDLENTKIFSNGEYQEELFNNDVFIYNRIYNNIKLVIIINNSNYDYYYNVDNAYDLINQLEINNQINVLSQTAMILKIEK